jgi:hypothetical protein
MKLYSLMIAILGFLVIMDLEELGAMAKKGKCCPKKKGGGRGKVSTCFYIDGSSFPHGA